MDEEGERFDDGGSDNATQRHWSKRGLEAICFTVGERFSLQFFCRSNVQRHLDSKTYTELQNFLNEQAL